jgi:hypothetical protein
MYWFVLSLLALALEPTASDADEAVVIPLGEERWKHQIASQGIHHYWFLGIRLPFKADVNVIVSVTANGRVLECKATVVTMIGEYDVNRKVDIEDRLIQTACHGMRRYARFEKSLDGGAETIIGSYETTLVFDLGSPIDERQSGTP